MSLLDVLTRMVKPSTPAEPVLHDCRNMRSLSFTPRDSGLKAMVAAHEGIKPEVGEYLFLKGDKGVGLALYRCVEVDHCYNVDPANMWIAQVEFVPGKEATKLNLPGPPA